VIIAATVVALLNLKEARDLPWRDYVDSQIARVDDRVLPPPPDIAVYFGSHREAFAEIRMHPETGENYRDQMLVTEILVAHALAHHDWDDLESAWEIQRGLWREPRTAYSALRGSRLINAAARKLPPPAPKWLSELSAFDARRAFAEASIVNAIRAAEMTEEKGATMLDRLPEAYFRAMGNDWAQATGIALKAMTASRACDVDPREYDDHVREALALWNLARFRLPRRGDVWHEVARFTAERELTAKILETKSGRTPSTLSKCSDGRWIVTPGHLRFSKPIEGQVPLEY
jgi:hypothetical protein